MQFITGQGLTSPTFKPPPLDGTFLLPDVFSHHAQHSPNHPLFVYPDEDKGPQTITWSHAVKAFHNAAHFFRTRVEIGPESSPSVVAILASTDQITYLHMIAGAMLAGYLPFPLSPRNSDAGIAHLLQSCSCTNVFELSEPSFTPRILLPLPKVQLDDPAVIMHSSGTSRNFSMTYSLLMYFKGSTAFPKTIPLTHRMFWESGLIPYYGDLDLCGEVLSVHALPMFHLLGLVQLPYAAFTGMAMSAFSPSVPPKAPTPDNVFEAAIGTNSTFLICTPSFLESWACEPARVAVMKKFLTVIFGGGPLQPSIGDHLVKNGVHVSHLYGLTEANTLSVFIPKSVPKDGWDYFPFSAHTDPGFVPVEDSPGVYQVYFKKCATHTPAILDSVIDGVPALNTKDLISRHPSNPNLWKIFGRQDDQIMHSNGEKTNPVPIEKILHENPAIKYAIMFGRGNFHTGVIIFPEEPFDPLDTERVIEFRRKIWPTVEQANRFAPTHSRIFKEMIMVANPSKPIEVTAKETPRRQAVLQMYTDEIREIYKTVEDSFQKKLTAPSEFDASSSLKFVRRIVSEVMLETPGNDDDIFQHGCNSLQATWIRNSILHASINSQEIDPKDIPNNFVYSHPTMRMLADMLTKVGAGRTSEPEEISRRADAMEAMVHKYTQEFQQHLATAEAPRAQAVLVTGTTGALGSHILAHLLALPEISIVYAFNRPSSNLRERQCKAFSENGLDDHLLDLPKLKLLAGNLNAPRFALCEQDFEALRANVTLIVHNAWQVNFNVSLSTMEPLVAGTRQLIDFALASPHASPCRLLFVDANGSNTALERRITDPRVSVGLGYTESKWVAEEVLQTAAEKTVLSPVIVRPGQLSGAANGAWNASDWFPVLVRSSQVLGHLPEISGQISWLPIHHAAKALVEMRDSEERYMHITHPHPVTITQILSPLSATLGIPLVPYSVWLECLERASSQESGASNPAVRLIDFYRSYRDVTAEQEAFFPTLLSNTVAVKVSPSLSSVAPLTGQDVERWTSYLRQGGYLL
ncbi:hypothetical protein B0H19DRAFT_1266811 [Mycena capillaripes]|nr:hypothetical protein B0H19DRAFT_1266811 [Mycena capillaripes]